MKMLKITQVKSTNKGMMSQISTVRSLGLRKIGQTVYHKDTPQIRGMITAVNHLVAFELVSEKPKADKKERHIGYKVVHAKKHAAKKEEE